MENKKILLITNQSKTVINFRKELILHLKEHNNEVFVISGDCERQEEIEDLGVTFFNADFDNRSKSVFGFFKTKRIFKKIIKEVNPDIVFTFQIKPNIIGVKAAHSCKIESIVSMVEGLGDPFQPKNFIGKMLMKLVTLLYKSSFRFAKKVFFLNNDDKSLFLDKKILPEEKAILITGIGIDTNVFKPITVSTKNTVLMLGRLLVNKGIYEFCEIAKSVRKVRKDISFILCGSEGQIKESDLKEYIDNEDIVYMGEIRDVKPILSSCKIYVSTSYREGFPRSIMEAMAMGKPVFATNVIGNKDVVIDNETGYLIENKNIKAFADAILSSIDDVDLLSRFGHSARAVCEQKFNSGIINSQIEKVLDESC